MFQLKIDGKSDIDRFLTKKKVRNELVHSLASKILNGAFVQVKYEA